MRLSRRDLIPLLTIVAGGVLGASLSLSLLGSRSDDERVVGGLYRTPATAEAHQLEEQEAVARLMLYALEQSVQSSFRQPVEVEVAKGFVGPGQIAIVSNGKAVIYKDGETDRNYLVRFTDEEQAAFERIEVLERRIGYVRERLAERRRDGDISN